MKSLKDLKSINFKLDGGRMFLYRDILAPVANLINNLRS